MAENQEQSPSKDGQVVITGGAASEDSCFKRVFFAGSRKWMTLATLTVVLVLVIVLPLALKGERPYWETNPPASIFTGPNYELRGVWDAETLAVQSAEDEWSESNPGALELNDELIGFFRSFGAQMAPAPERYVQWSEFVTIDQVNRPASREMWYQVHTPAAQNGCGLVYYHGGGGFMGAAAEYNHHVARIAVETGCILFNVDFRNAPESNLEKGDSGVIDAYNAAIDVSNKVENGDYPVEADRLAYFGESGGGWIAGGVGLQLATNEESERFRFQLLQIPMVGNMYVTSNPPEFNEIEQGMKEFQEQTACLLYNGDYTCDYEETEFNPLIFSNEMGLELAAKVPPTIVYSTEFDYYRKMAEEACYLYEEAGTLLDCGFQAGTSHSSSVDWNYGAHNLMYVDMVRITEAYLN